MAARTERTRGKALIVEDEYLVSLEIVSLLEDAGFEVVGPAARVQEALALAAAETLTIAVLDINLAGEESWPVAHYLKANGVPFLFLTGYAASQVQRPPELADVPMACKPLNERNVEEIIRELLR